MRKIVKLLFYRLRPSYSRLAERTRTAEPIRTVEGIDSTEETEMVNIVKVKEFIRTWLPPEHDLRGILDDYEDHIPYSVWLGLAGAVIRIIDRYADKLAHNRTAQSKL